MSTCARQCWIFAAIMGLVVFALSSLAGGIGPLPGLFMGLVTAGLLGGLMAILFCQGADDVEEWKHPVESAKDPDAPAHRSIRCDDGPIARVPIAQPVRPEGMEGAPTGASANATQAVTFKADGSSGGAQASQGAPEGEGASDASSRQDAEAMTTDASRLARQRQAGGDGQSTVLADGLKTAHSGSVGQSESA